jgi:hypothetical protein
MYFILLYIQCYFQEFLCRIHPTLSINKDLVRIRFRLPFINPNMNIVDLKFVGKAVFSIGMISLHLHSHVHVLQCTLSFCSRTRTF